MRWFNMACESTHDVIDDMRITHNVLCINLFIVIAAIGWFVVPSFSQSSCHTAIEQQSKSALACILKSSTASQAGRCFVSFIDHVITSCPPSACLEDCAIKFKSCEKSCGVPPTNITCSKNCSHAGVTCVTKCN